MSAPPPSPPSALSLKDRLDAARIHVLVAWHEVARADRRGAGMWARVVGHTLFISLTSAGTCASVVLDADECDDKPHLKARLLHAVRRMALPS